MVGLSCPVVALARNLATAVLGHRLVRPPPPPLTEEQQHPATCTVVVLNSAEEDHASDTTRPLAAAAAAGGAGGASKQPAQPLPQQDGSGDSPRRVLHECVREEVDGDHVRRPMEVRRPLERPHLRSPCRSRRRRPPALPVDQLFCVLCRAFCRVFCRGRARGRGGWMRRRTRGTRGTCHSMRTCFDDVSRPLGHHVSCRDRGLLRDQCARDEWTRDPLTGEVWRRWTCHCRCCRGFCGRCGRRDGGAWAGHRRCCSCCCSCCDCCDGACGGV